MEFVKFRLAGRITVLTLAVLVMGLWAEIAFAQRDNSAAVNITANAQTGEGGILYWTQDSTIFRVASDGTGQETAVKGIPLRYPVFTADGNTMYGIGDDHVIRRANASGAQLTALIMAEETVEDSLRLDEAGGKLYWAEETRIRRANLDGSEVETLTDSLFRPADGLILHPASGKLYWREGPNARRLWRVDMAGGTREELFHVDPPARALGCVSLDPVDEKLYWHFHESGIRGPVMRANLDGSDVETLPLGDDICPVIDVEGRKIYWRTGGRIRRSNMDGGNIETLHDADRFQIVNHLVIDSASQTLYWWLHAGTNLRKYQRMEMDGGTVEDVAEFPQTSSDDEPMGLRINHGAQKLYWEVGGQIRRANMNGDTVEIVVFGAKRPASVVVNPVDNQLYWSDRHGIYRSTLNGEDLLLLVPFQRPYALTLDIDNQVLYWVSEDLESGDFFIRRAPLDTLEVEQLGELGGLVDSPFIFSLDTMSIYYTRKRAVDQTLNGIARANLDGSEASLLLSLTEGLPDDYALERESGHLYWIGGIVDGTIQRANLDASEVTELVSGLDWPRELELDIASGKMYWISENEDEEPVIWRANLDGSERELFLAAEASSLYFDAQAVQNGNGGEEPGEYSLFVPAVVAD